MLFTEQQNNTTDRSTHMQQLKRNATTKKKSKCYVHQSPTPTNPQRYIYKTCQILNFVHTFINNRDKLPDIFISYFVENRCIHYHDTRKM